MGPAAGRRPAAGAVGHTRPPDRALRRAGGEWTDLTTRHYAFRYHSPEHYSEWFRQFYGPITRLAGTLSGADLDRFADDLADVARRFNRADDGTVVAPSEYLEAVGVRRG